MKSLRRTLYATVAVAASFASPIALATPVSSGGFGVTGTLTDLGSFAAGTYQITASGIVDLVGAGGTFQMSPDGTPAAPVSAAGYAYFNPVGSYIADGNYGAAGSNARIGALIGTLTATPASASDWFLIGYAKTITLTNAGHIYASVNDTYHQNNVGSFEVNVAAVPEPESYALFLAGVGLMGTIARRRRMKPAA